MKEEAQTSTFLSALIDLTAGGIGGTLNVLTGQPLDTVKVKMQVFPDVYKNSFVCFKETFLQDGVKGLYAGTVPAIAANVAENSVLFAVYGISQNAVKKLVNKTDVKQLSSFENAMSGFFAAFFSSVTLCPTELVKCRLQGMREMQELVPKEKRIHIGPWSLTKDIVKKGGLSALFQGFWATVLREMPGYFFFFGAYEFCREKFASNRESKDEIGLIKTTISGGFGGICFWLAVFPFDALKSRMQISGTKDNVFEVANQIVKKEGFGAFYKGIVPCLIRTFPATGCLFVGYEYTRRYMNMLVNS